jgi:hypothetical protein
MALTREDLESVAGWISSECLGEVSTEEGYIVATKLLAAAPKLALACLDVLSYDAGIGGERILLNRTVRAALEAAGVEAPWSVRPEVPDGD